MKKRMLQRELFLRYPHEVQLETLNDLLATAAKTEFGEAHRFSALRDVNDFRAAVPLQDYETLKPAIQQMMEGRPNVLWPTEIKWFAKSSGTTSDRSKFIPVSQESLEDCHFKGGKDMLSIYCQNFPNTKLFSGKGLSVGGSHQINQFNQKSYYGDLSAVLIQNLPLWAELYRTPKLRVALMDEWESKIGEMAKQTVGQDITNIQGVPSWTLVLLQRVLQLTGAKSILEVWPNLEVFFHGAVSFIPYRDQFREIVGGHGIRYMETYNASEGFFGIQDRPNDDSLLLMLDYGIFYEFIPMENWDDSQPITLGLKEVELDRHYALVISTNGGLWRYRIGDTVMFTSLAPYRIKITGRTKHFINAFGEELIIDNAENALKAACEQTGALITDYTAAPYYIEGGEKGAHEWLIEFSREPNNLERFINLLDSTLCALNSDYEAKRYKNLILQRPKVRAVPTGTFYTWLKRKGKLGGQHKVPRLSNDRKMLEELLSQLNGSH
jgi:hypothetical protein